MLQTEMRIVGPLNEMIDLFAKLKGRNESIAYIATPTDVAQVDAIEQPTITSTEDQTVAETPTHTEPNKLPPVRKRGRPSKAKTDTVVPNQSSEPIDTVQSSDVPTTDGPSVEPVCETVECTEEDTTSEPQGDEGSVLEKPTEVSAPKEEDYKAAVVVAKDNHGIEFVRKVFRAVSGNPNAAKATDVAVELWAEVISKLSKGPDA